jgi:hypothetical protein
MSFLNPILLAALAAAAIPVIIHLINFRKPRKIAFSTLAFFQELQKSTIRRINLKRYLLMAMRVMAVTMLALALARPFLPSQIAGWLGAPAQSDHIAILLDNGPSMAQIDEAGPYMDQALGAATEIVDQAGDQARFLIVPTHGELASGRFMRRAEALRFLEQMQPVNKGGFLAQRMTYIQDRLDDEPGGSGRIYWVSDARKTQVEQLEGGFLAANTGRDWHPVTFIRVGGDAFRNVAMSSVETTGQILGAGIPVGVSVTVRNFGEQPVYNTFLSLEIDGERMGQYEVNLEAGQERELLFEVIPESPGIIRGRAILEGAAQTFDHHRYFSIEVPESRSVLLITDRGEDGTRRSYLRPALIAASETGTRIKATHTDISSLRDYDLDNFDAIILESPRRVPEYLQAELVQFVQQGRGMLFVPSEQGNIENYNRFLARFSAGTFTGMRGTYGRFEEVASLQPLDSGHLLASDLFESEDEEELRIDMPAIYHYWRYQRAVDGSGATVLRTNLGEPLFMEHSFGDGMVMVGTMGFSPGWSNLAIKPIYAPLVYRMLLYVVAWEHGGAREHILGAPFDRYFAEFGTHVTIRLNGDEIRPETSASARGLRVRYAAQEWEPGWLELQLDEKKTAIAINQNISESDFASLSMTETRQFLSEIIPVAGVVSIAGYSADEIRTAMASISFGREIWNWFIWMALAFMVAECIISRKYRTETADG